ncbi:MAG: DUF2252 domain-containing protein [Gemmatimonadaceae bacterium]|jgi:hypothetical protein|nr:DUF2252 domain-containing protein [Gemmatimonadaceae bacterium]
MPALPSIVDDTERYERWLATAVPVQADGLALKHERMSESPFALLRASYYRWLTLWRAHAGPAREAMVVRSVGDLHIENFGTWRDGEGRLVWGINDFDEASPQPWTSDLVRLATSAMLAMEHGDIAISPKAACEAIWEGYREAIDARGRPFVLAEVNRRLRAMATERLKDPQRFWDGLTEAPEPEERVPRSARRTLERALPPGATAYAIRTRVSGLGSLGRARYVVLADWGGAHVAREVKSLAPPAHCLVEGIAPRTWLAGTVRRAVRVADPCFAVDGRWIVRRLAPDCSRIELRLLPGERDEAKLLHAMGWEAANVHLGSASRRQLRRDTSARAPRWLVKASRVMHDAVHEDFAAWEAHRRAAG